MALRYVTQDELVRSIPSGAIVVTDSNVAEAWSSLVQPLEAIVVPAGEESKTWNQAGHLVENFAERGLKRSGVVVALGGGVIGDLVGFAASAYMRGVDLIQIPTTLLAMVDSSIGGKVGVDLPHGKNLAGAFHSATEILVCDAFLETLPEREWLCGSAEVWKYGAIMDTVLFETLEAAKLEQGVSHLLDTIRTCASHKEDIVQRDPFEKTGLRAILNFGHTLAHALEKCLNFQVLSHGEAVAIGMVFEAELGERLGITGVGTADRLRLALAYQGLPVAIPSGIRPIEMVQAMGLDKKSDANGLAFSFLVGLGECKLVRGVSLTETLDLLVERCG